MSSTVLNTIADQRFDSILDFMHAVQQAGFTDEFDNSLVMRMIWKKFDELKRLIGNDEGKTYFTTKTEPHPLHGIVLIVTLHSTSKEDVSVFMVLFVRDASIAVSSNVITDEVKPESGKAEVPASGVYMFEAEKMFKSCQHFDKVAYKAFKAMHKALSPKGDAVAVRLQITPQQFGWRVEYRKYGEKILVTHFDFNKQ